jgi:hypothetical protein
MILGTVALIAAIVLVLWIVTPLEDRYIRLTPRQERKLGRLAELDEARAALLEELGIEPTAAELWELSPPSEEQN